MGERGSGAIFFAHCALGCVYCQNKRLAAGEGVDASLVRLAEIMLELQNEHHAANINLVTASHYAPSVASVLRTLRLEPGYTSEDLRGAVFSGSSQVVEGLSATEGLLRIPVVWNTSGYESVDTLALLEGLVDIYLVDLKYASATLAQRLSRAADYPEVALAAIEHMLSQVGEPRFDEKGLLRKGVIVRHLVLPGYVDESLAVLDLLWEHFGGRILLSVMNQFTIVDDSFDPGAYGLERAVSDEDYERVLDHADGLGFEDYFWQEGGAAEKSFIPAFDGTGVLRFKD